MNVVVQAFDIELGKGISTSDLYNSIVGLAGTPLEDRYLYLTKEGDLWMGLLLTARNIKAFSKMRKERNRIQIEPVSLGESEIAHFNYFILNAKHQRGLFQKYHGAASINVLGYQLRSHYNQLKEQKVIRDCNEDGGSPSAPPKHIKNRYAGHLNWSIVLRRNSFESLISDLEKIKNATIQFTEYMPDCKAFQPIASKAKVIRHRLTFQEQHRGAIKRDLIRLSKFPGLKSLSGVGVDSNGLEQKFKLLNEPETLGVFNFNEVALETTFDSNRISDSIQGAPMIKRLQDIGNNDPWFTGEV